MTGRVILVLAVWGAIAHGPSWGTPPADFIHWRDDLRAATQEVFHDRRPMLLLFTMDGCGYCQLIKETTLADRHVVARVNQDFVPMRVHGAEHRWLAQRLGVRVYPTMVIISPENRVVERMEGYVKTPVILPKLAAAMHAPAQARAASTPTR